MNVQDKVVKLLFDEYVICDVLVDKLIPEQTWTPEAKADLTAEQGYDLARSELKVQLKRLLGG